MSDSDQMCSETVTQKIYTWTQGDTPKVLVCMCACVFCTTCQTKKCHGGVRTVTNIKKKHLKLKSKWVSFIFSVHKKKLCTFDFFPQIVIIVYCKNSSAEMLEFYPNLNLNPAGILQETDSLQQCNTRAGKLTNLKKNTKVTVLHPLWEVCPCLHLSNYSILMLLDYRKLLYIIWTFVL